MTKNPCENQRSIWRRLYHDVRLRRRLLRHISPVKQPLSFVPLLDAIDAMTRYEHGRWLARCGDY